MQKASVQEINIDSSVSAISTKLVQFRDCTVLIDDLCTCSTNAEKRKRLETFSSILRKLSNESPFEYHIPGKRENARAYCQCTAVFTAEYPLSSELMHLQNFFQSLSVSAAQERRMFWNYAYIVFTIQSFARFVEQTHLEPECAQTIEQPLNLFLHQLGQFKMLNSN